MDLPKVIAAAAQRGIRALQRHLAAGPPEGVSPEAIKLFFLKHRRLLIDELARLVEAALAGRSTEWRARLAQQKTPGTRLVWSSLREWLDALRTITRRHEFHPSAATYAARAAHWAALDQATIGSAQEPELAELKQRVPRVPSGVHPNDPQRALRVRVLDWIERRSQALRKPG